MQRSPQGSVLTEKICKQSQFSSLMPSFIRNRLAGRNVLKKVVANTGWMFADKLIRFGLGFFVNVLIVRYLGPGEFGILSYALAFTGLWGTLTTLGLDNIVIRDLVKDPSLADEILGSAFFLKLAAGIIVFLLAIGTIYLTRPGDTLTFWLTGIIAAGFIFHAFDVIDFYFQSQVQSKYSVLSKNSAFIIIALLKIILILNKAPLIVFAWTALGEIALGAIGLFVSYNFTGHWIMNWRMNMRTAVKLLKEGWALILTGVVIAIYVRIDILMLRQMRGEVDAGYYAVASQLSEMWYIIPAIVSISIYPTLIQLYHQSEDLYTKKLQQVMGLFFITSTLLSVFVLFMAKHIITLLYGNAYLLSADILRIHIFAGIIVSMSIIFSHRYILNGTIRIFFYSALCGAIANVLLNLWLIPLYAGIGAAIATVISYTLPIIVTLFFDKSIGRIFMGSVLGSFKQVVVILPKRGNHFHL